jgi:hypothetical protein
MSNIENTTSEERKPILAVRFGRGRTGGTTFLDFLVQRARRAGRDLLIGDGDRNNATLSGLYPPGAPGGALQPRTGEIADATEWVTEICSRMAEERVSMVLDMGGGDKVLSEHSNDMALPEFCQAAGIEPLAIYMMGPDREDLQHVANIFEAGYFRAEKALLVLNESMVKAGKGAAGAFEFIYKEERLKQVLASVEIVYMPKLACMDAMRAERLTFFEAAAGKKGASGRALSLGHQFMVKTWLNRMDEAIADVEAWLP